MSTDVSIKAVTMQALATGTDAERVELIRETLTGDCTESLAGLQAHIEAGGSLRKVTKVVRELMANRQVHPEAIKTDLSKVPERFRQVIDSKEQYLMNLKFAGDLLVGLLRSARDAIFRWFKVGAVEDAKQVLAKLRPIASS